MAQVLDAGKNLVKLDNGKTITADRGGWYDGQQYWGGTLSQKGVINSLSDQIGAGKAVSAEVNAASAKLQGVSTQQFNTYLATPNKTAPAAPATTQQAQATLNEFGSGLFSAANSAPSRVQTVEEIAATLKTSGILPTGQAPTPPSLATQFQELSEAKGVDAIQGRITELKAQQDEIAAQLRVNTAAERGKPVAQNIIEGRVSVQQRDKQEEYDFVSRQLSRKTDEMNSALNSIQMIMQFSQTDYQNASQAYSQQFDRAITTFNLIRGIQQDQKTDEQRAIDNARANAQIFVNALKDGSLDIRSLPADQAANLAKMEVQAGLPIGFFSAIKKDPKADIISTSTTNGVTQVLTRNPDGSVAVNNYGTPIKDTSGGGAPSKDQQASYYRNAAIEDARKGATLGQMFSIYTGVIAPNDIYTLYNANSKYGPDKGSIDNLRKYGVTLK